MNNKKVGGLLGIFGLFSLIILSHSLTTNEFSNAYVCIATEEVGIFYGGLSSTGLTAYPYLENRSVYKRCYSRNGNYTIKSKWVSLLEYSKMKNIDPLEFLYNRNDNLQISHKYICNLTECIKIQ